MIEKLRSRLFGERGSALVEFVTLGLMFLVPLMWFVLGVFSVQSAFYGVNAASREAGRAFVLAPSESEAVEQARTAAEVSLGDQGLSLSGPDPVDFHYVCEGGCLDSGSYVRITITHHVDLTFLPEYFDGIKPTYKVESVHRTPYGVYRQSR